MHPTKSLLVAGGLATLQLALGFRLDYWILGLLALAREIFLDSPIPGELLISFFAFPS